jgi:rubredoxin-NAD+ reductase
VGIYIVVRVNKLVYVACTHLQQQSLEGIFVNSRFYGKTEGLMKKWQCIVCGFIYDEAEGNEDEGFAPGTRWEDISEDWICPDCGVSKADFEMVEID